MKIQEKYLSKHKGKIIFSAIWLLIGLWFMFSYTPTVNMIGPDGSGGLAFFERQHQWYENFVPFLLMFVAPVGVVWGISHWRNKSEK